MCFGNISADFNPANGLKTELRGYVYDFLVEYHITLNNITLKYMIFTLI